MKGTCVVTGSEGYIGQHVVKALSSDGYQVHGIDLAQHAPYNMDVCDTEKLSKLFEQLKPDFVFHLAGVANARTALTDPVTAVNTNITGTASVLEATQRAEAQRFILASSCWVFNAMAAADLSEASPFLNTGGGHIYTTTKLAAEFLTHDFQKNYGLQFTILRYGIPYGPGMWPGLVLRNFLDNAFAKKPLTVFHRGSTSRRFVYIEDLAAAHCLALKEKAINQIYHLEGLHEVTILELAQLVCKFVGKTEIVYQEDASRKGEPINSNGTILSAKAFEDLGWQPQIGIEEGVRRTIEWYCTSVMAQNQASN